MKFTWILSVIALGFTSVAQAEQGCPPGQIPAQSNGSITSCGPILSGYYEQQQPAAPRPSGKWIKTWGAIAMGSIDSITSYGVTTGKTSKSEASKDALKRCASHREDNCEIKFTYFNQCVAIAEPHINGKPFSTGIVRFIGAGTTVEASEYAQKECKESNKAVLQAKCEIVYKACSEPIFKNF